MMFEQFLVTRENLQMLESELVMLEHDIARLVKKAKGSEVHNPSEQISRFMQDNPLLIERLAELVLIKALVDIFGRRLQPQ